MELRKIWEIVWRRRWIVIQAFLIIILVATVSTYLITPQYETSAKLFIKSSESASSILKSIGLSDFSGTTTVQTDSNIEITNNVTLSTITPILKQLISLLQLRDKNGNLMKPADLVKSNILISSIFPKPYIEIKEIENTDLIEIKARSPEPIEAAMIANTLAEVYLEEHLKQQKEEYRIARIFIEERIKLAKTEYLESLKEIERFKIKEKTVDIEIEKKIAIEKMSDLMKEKEDSVIEIAKVKAKIETLKKQLNKQDENIVSSLAISENPVIEELKKTLLKLETDLSEALAEKTAEHVDIKILKEKIKKNREELKKEMGIFQESSKELYNFERELSALEVHLSNVNEEINKYMDLLSTIPEKELFESQLKLKNSASKELYSALLEYLHQVGVAEAMMLSDIRIVEPATEPAIGEPFSPNITLNVIMGVFVGLIFGLGLAFLTDYLDDTIKTPQDVREHGAFTFLAAIPMFKKNENLIISQRDPQDPICESYRRLRNSIRFSSLDKQSNNILVTSCSEGEGKTITTINLGISLGREEKQILLVDLNFRKPKIHEYFGVPNSPGIINVIAKEVEIKEAIKKTNINNISILPSGPIPSDPGQMIESNSMNKLLKSLIQQYDFVIFDTSPIFPVYDAIVLAGYVDNTLMVLENKKVTRQTLSRVKAFFEQANINTIGLVLNKFKNSKV